MIYSILITICLATAPTDCRTYEQPMPPLPAHPAARFVEAQVYVAQWMEQHPAFRLKAWRIEPGRGA
jgi:hypothetical protein